jgi:hypothetical protein
MLSLNILTLQVICGVIFYIVILLARINARITALLRQEFGIPSGNVRVLSADFHGHERGGLKTGRKMSVERGFLLFKSLIMKDSDYSKISAQTAKSANLIVFI